MDWNERRVEPSVSNGATTREQLVPAAAAATTTATATAATAATAAAKGARTHPGEGGTSQGKRK